MLRRVLPVAAAAAAAVVLVPSTASATPDEATVDVYQGQYLGATAQDVVLPNGWHATAYLSDLQGTNLRHGRAFLYLDVWTTYPCWGEVCESHSWTDKELAPEQVKIDRSLRTASVEDVTVELIDPATWVPDPLPGEDPYAGGDEPWTGEDPYAGGDEPWTGEDPYAGGEDPYAGGEDPYAGGEDPYAGGEDPYAGGEDPYAGGEDPYAGGEDPEFPTPVEPESMTLTLSLTFSGTGPVDRTASHSTMCGDGDRECQAIRVEAHRQASSRLVLGDWSGDTSVGSLVFGRTVDAAAPKFDFDEY